MLCVFIFNHNKKKKLPTGIITKFKFLKISVKYFTQDLALSAFFINRNYCSFFNETMQIIKSIDKFLLI